MTEALERYLPLYQGIMATTFDHRAADVVRSETATKRQNQPSYLDDFAKSDPRRVALPMYWVSEGEVLDRLREHRDAKWILSFRDVTSVTNERTMVPAGIPVSGVGNKTPLVIADQGSRFLYAVLSSFVADFLVRQKLGGTTMNYFYVRQFPVPLPGALDESIPWGHEKWSAWVGLRVDELVANSWDIIDFLDDLPRAPFVWDSERRLLLRAEVDAAFFHLYGVERDDVDYIMDTFPIVRRKEEAAYGEYRTKRLVLEVFDAMQGAIDSGTEYETILDPPPGEGACHAPV